MATNQSTPAAKDSDLLSGSLIITRPFYKYALLAFVLGSVVAVIWAFFGSIPHRIEGLGEINTKDGLFKVTTTYQGQIDKINVGINDYVKKGQVLFVLKQPELEHSLGEMQEEIRILEAKNSQLKSDNAVSYGLKADVNAIEKQRIQSQINEADKTISFLEKKIEQNEKLFKDGLITYSQVFDTEKSLADAHANKAGLTETLQSLSLSTQEWKLGKTMGEKDIENEIEQLRTKFSDLQKEYILNTEIISTTAGYVVQMNVGPGDVIAAGMNLATIELPNNHDNYILDLFVPFSSNAKISQGMAVDIEPFMVDRNLYGWLKGKVVDVDEYVSSGASLSDKLSNEDLAKLVETKGPVYKVKVEIITDSSTVSGFAWSNKKGPPYKVNTGALCKAYVRVKEKAPVDFLIPIFKKYFE